jgi:hypothetical protein
MTKEDSPKLITTLMTIPNQRLDPVKDTYIMFQERPAGMPQAMKAWFYPGRSTGEEFIYPKQQAAQIAQANNTSVLSSEGDNVGRVGANGAFERDSAAASASSSTPAQSTTTTTTTTTADSNTAPAAGSNPATASAAPSTTAAAPSTTTGVTRETASGTSSTTTAPSTTAAAAPDAAAQAPAPVAQAPAPVAEAPAVTAPARAVRQAPAPVGTAGQVARNLPRTASPLALFELISALSIAGAAGLRQLRKRA